MNLQPPDRNELITELRDSIAQARHFLDFLDKLYMLMPAEGDTDKLAQWGKIADGMRNTAVPVPARPKIWENLAGQIWDELSCVVEEYHKDSAKGFPDYFSTIKALDALDHAT